MTRKAGDRQLLVMNLRPPLSEDLLRSSQRPWPHYAVIFITVAMDLQLGGPDGVFPFLSCDLAGLPDDDDHADPDIKRCLTDFTLQTHMAIQTNP